MQSFQSSLNCLPRCGVMTSVRTLGLCALILAGVVRGDDSEYKLGPDSEPKAGIPQGTVSEYTWDSKIYDGTHRRFYVYVPAQYDPEKPTAVMVFQDGHTYVNPKGKFLATVVLDNLIAAGEVPVTLGIFIDPGHRKALPDKPGWEPAPENRSVEYDTVSDVYATFLEQEILPEVSKSLNLTSDPDQRAICGISSGGICAFGVAWHRPDLFRRVLSHVGSFVDIRGGHNYPPMIRKAGKKPLRVFLQDGSGDLDNRFGNWPLANQQMAAALKFKGYEYEFVFGTGGHNDIHGGSIMPESMRWLWKSHD